MFRCRISCCPSSDGLCQSPLKPRALGRPLNSRERQSENYADSCAADVRSPRHRRSDQLCINLEASVATPKQTTANPLSEAMDVGRCRPALAVGAPAEIGQAALTTWLGLVNKHYRRSLFDVRAEQDGIPIRQPDAPVGFGFADFGRIGRAVETISLRR